MILTYINRREGEEPIIRVYDADSAVVKNALSWINAKVNGGGYAVRQRISSYTPGVPDTIGGQPGQVVSVHGDVYFMLPEGTKETDYVMDGAIVADLSHCVETPAAAVAGIIIGANLNIPLASIGEYMDPDAGKPPLEDWQVPGARIGEPLASAPGHFRHRGEGGKYGDIWVGASGAKYELVSIGAFAFFRSPAWKKL